MKSSNKHEQVKKVKQIVKLLPSCSSLFPVDFDIDQIPTQHDLSSVGHTLDSTCPCPWTPVALGNTRAWACDSSCAAYCLRDQIWLATKSGRTKSAFCVEDEMMGATDAAAIVASRWRRPDIVHDTLPSTSTTGRKSTSLLKITNTKNVWRIWTKTLATYLSAYIYKYF